MKPGSRIASSLVVVAALIGASSSSARASEVPAGTEIVNGIVAHMTPTGVHYMEAQIPYVVPSSIAIPTIGPTQTFSCLFDSNKATISNGMVHLAVTKVTITPQEGKLKLHLDLTASATAHAHTAGCLVDVDCNISVGNSAVTADTTVALTMVNDPQTGRPKVKATTEQFSTNINLGNLNVCSGLAGDVLSFIANLFSGSISGAVNGAFHDQVQPLISPTIEGAFNSINLQGSFGLAGTELDYDLYPTGLQIHPGTIGVIFGGTFDTPTAAACVDATKGFEVDGAPAPIYTDLSPSGAQYHVVAGVADDMLNQVAFSLWRGGLMCRNIDSIGGTPLTGSYLSLVGGELTHIVDTDGPMIVHVEAEDPPVVTVGGAGSTIGISLSNLHIDLYGTVQDRLARIMRLTLAPTAGATLSLNASHQVVVTLNFDPSQLAATADYNELAPDASATVISLLPTLVQQLVPQLADAIPPIDLPDLGGVTIDAMEFAPDPSGHYLSAYTTLGGHVQPGGCSVGGIGGSGGCGTTGSLGCDLTDRHAASNVATMPLMFGLALGVVALRRRGT